MSTKPTISFAGLTAPTGGVLAVFAGEGAALAASVPPAVSAAVVRGAGIAKFKGKRLATLRPARCVLSRMTPMGRVGSKGADDGPLPESRSSIVPWAAGSSRVARR